MGQGIAEGYLQSQHDSI
jgi:hypothetical protein